MPNTPELLLLNNHYLRLVALGLLSPLLGSCFGKPGGDVTVDYLANIAQSSLPVAAEETIGPRQPLRFDFSNQSTTEAPSGRLLYRKVTPKLKSSQGHIMPGALSVEGRTEPWHGPIIALPNLKAGQAFTVSAWVKPLDTLESTHFTLVLNRILDGNSTQYTIAKSLVEPGNWQKVEGDFVATPHGGDVVRALLLNVEPAFTNYLLDDITVAYAEFSEELEAAAVESAKSLREGYVINGSAEQGLVPWSHQGGGFITRSSAQAHSGDHSVLITGRTAGWQGPLMEIRGLEDNENYNISIYTRLKEGEQAAAMKLTLKRQTNGQATFVSIDEAKADDTGWVELSGLFSSANISQSELVHVYVESTHPTVAYYVDSLSIQKLPSAVAETP